MLADQRTGWADRASDGRRPRDTGPMDDITEPWTTGGCLCRAVRYRVTGPLRDVEICHCSRCRRTHGHVGAYTEAPLSALTLTAERGLRWYIADGRERGFCGECGARPPMAAKRRRSDLDRRRDVGRAHRPAHRVPHLHRQPRRLLRDHRRTPPVSSRRAARALVSRRRSGPSMLRSSSDSRRRCLGVNDASRSDAGWASARSIERSDKPRPMSTS